MNFYSTFYGKSAHVLIWLIMNPVTLALLNKSFLINKIRLTVFKARLFLNNYLQYLMEITFAAWKISLKWQASLSKTYRILLLWKWCGKMDASTYFFFFFRFEFWFLTAQLKQAYPSLQRLWRQSVYKQA